MCMVKSKYEEGALLMIDRNPKNVNIPLHLRERFKAEFSYLFSNGWIAW